ncbi:Origin of replication complex subunit 4 [Gracilariopsis chorda]|uniref:Origin of replication complex subunit 4 n=1 Tax=Gracilariopsis chorda TaxID=448386 RepID=A0A2V3IUB4_9FLOR|nr:Origin of replication complex subunit 4 [Gracilariopsis chorda]|eukprot:PXF45701.1 Origin of replication complex subunit 4 [Gracilariopsis chorda]
MHAAQWRARLFDAAAELPLPQPLRAARDLVVATLAPPLSSPLSPPTSVLLSGAHGSGKALLTRHALRALRRHHPRLTCITLHGLLHSTPIRAWRHVAAALQPRQQQHLRTAPVEHCLAVIAHELQQFRAAHNAILFVLHHFDAFVTSSQPSAQTVLYSLLNFLQDVTLRAACIATTSAVDVTDALEKRVKSRFTHRHIVLPLPRSATHLLPTVSQALLQPPTALAHPTPKRKCNSKFRAPPSAPVSASQQFLRSFLDHPRCASLINTKLARNRAPAALLTAIDVSLTSFLSHNRLASQNLTAKKLNPLLQSALDTFEATLFPPAPQKHILLTLSALEIALLVALRKLDTPRTPFDDSKRKLTFDHAFRHYQALSTTGKGMLRGTRDGEPTLPKPVAEKAWEKLVESGLIVRVGTAPRHLRACHLAVEAAAVDEAIQQHNLASTEMKRWAKSSTS